MTTEAVIIGVDDFIAGLASLGLTAERRGGLVVYRVTPVAGAFAGVEVETGIDASELGGWPRTPPHWIHAPSTFTIPGGSQQESEHAGWSRYSRPHPGRLDAAACPIREWVAHVRALLGTAS